METILGIDLGTTNSVVSIIRDGDISVLEEDGQKILPSVVGLDPEGNLLVGFPARNQWTLAPDRTVRSIKRKMGSDETVQLADQVFQLEVLHGDRTGAERVRFNDVGAGLQVLAMEVDDRLRPRQAEDIDEVLQMLVMISKPLAAHVLLVQPQGLEHGPHCPVQDQDPLRE